MSIVTLKFSDWETQISNRDDEFTYQNPFDELEKYGVDVADI